MSDTPASPRPVVRRRFAPVPIETTVESFRKEPVQSTHGGGPHGHHSGGNGNSHTVGPTAELTPSPSPQSGSPRVTRLWTKQQDVREPRWMQVKEKRRFAPQLIDSSRRSRRAGDVGPATKPIDKTDITPYQNHIYAPKPRKKHRKVQSLARRESCDEETAGRVFEVLAREAEKRMLEDAALAAFPNSRARAGGAEHFAIRDGSEDDDYSSGRNHATVARHGETMADAAGAVGVVGAHTGHVRTGRRSRRESHTEDVGWALREMQEHHEQLAQARAASVARTAEGREEARASPMGRATTSGSRAALAQSDRVSTFELDRMSIDSPPSDPLWTTQERASSEELANIGEPVMPLVAEEPVAVAGSTAAAAHIFKLRETEAEGGNVAMTDSVLPSLRPKASDTPMGGAADVGMDAEGPSAEKAFRARNIWAAYGNRDMFATEREVNRLRKKSPPMLGKNLVFRQCASPQQTKLETDMLWHMEDVGAAQDALQANRDPSEKQGLWRGYCYTNEKNQAVVPIERPALLATPFPPSSPVATDPFAHAFAMGAVVYEEPAMDAQMEEAGPGPAPAMSAGLWGGAVSTKTAKTRGGAAVHGSGLHPLHRTMAGGSQAASTAVHQVVRVPNRGQQVLSSLDERLQQDRAVQKLEAKIAAEFTDRFVTQVFNYLSLGYPSMARGYDDELAKISRIPADALRQDDNSVEVSAKGHISLGEDDSEEEEKEEEGGGGDATTERGRVRRLADGNDVKYNHANCPRWQALKLYILEWARQHPNLDSISPLAWGMQERRGSWGV